MRAPPVVVLRSEPEVMFDTARDVVVALVKIAPVAFKKEEVAFVVLKFVAKRLVEVALVEVAKLVVRAAIEEEAAISPPLKESIVLVAFDGKRYAKVDPASVPQLRTPVALAFTSQDAALRLETTRSEVEAPERNDWRALNALAVYVFGMVVDASAK